MRIQQLRYLEKNCHDWLDQRGGQTVIYQPTLIIPSNERTRKGISSTTVLSS